MTRPTVDVLSLLISAPKDDPLWGAKISELADLGKSTVSQILTRLTAMGWLTLREESGAHPGRPPRMFHTMSRKGRRLAAIALAARDARQHRQALDPTPPQAPTPAARQPIGSADRPSSGPGSPSARQAPKLKGYWPIRFPETPTWRTTPEGLPHSAADWPFREGEDVPAHLTELTGILATLDGANQRLTRDMFTRAATGPTHAEHYEKLVRCLVTQTSELHRRMRRVPHARPRNQGSS
ncbi:hypothetical protein ABZ820_36775 [Streptomyces diacarni]|uniref:MarR family transcriptional regulator n=1 Tax=Streptomyces diacarni TaxID=2800381 RepID=UPI0033F1B677